MARWKYTTQKWRKKSPSAHHHTTLLGCIFATKARINNWKKLVKQQYALHMSSQYGKLRPTNGWDRFGSLGPPANFNRFYALAALLHGTQVVGISQTLWRWAEGATCIRQGGHHVGHRPVFFSFRHKDDDDDENSVVFVDETKTRTKIQLKTKTMTKNRLFMSTRWKFKSRILA